MTERRNMIDINSISKSELEEAVKNSKNYADLIRKIGYRSGGSYLRNLKYKMEELDIDFSHLIKNVQNQYSNKNIAGIRYGLITVLNSYRVKGIHKLWKCRCDCGKEIEVYQTHLIQGNTKSCGCQKYSTGEEHRQWNGHGEISGGRFWAIKNGAKRRNIPFEVSIEYIWNLFLKQNRKCALSGCDLEFGLISKEYGTASLDRIDNNVGYIEGNVWWVHKDINKMKNVFDLPYFIKMCNSISKKSGGACEIGELGLAIKASVNEKLHV
jgi:hypothetical protein